MVGGAQWLLARVMWEPLQSAMMTLCGSGEWLTCCITSATCASLGVDPPVNESIDQSVNQPTHQPATTHLLSLSKKVLFVVSP